MEANQYKIIVIEDEPHILEIISIFLESEGIQVKGYLDPELAKLELEQNNLDLLICDVILGEQNGVQFVQKCSQTGFIKPVLIISGYVPNANEFPTNWTFLRKPFSRADLLNSVENLLPKKV